MVNNPKVISVPFPIANKSIATVNNFNQVNHLL